MKRKIYLLLILFFSLFLFSSCSKITYNVTIHYKDSSEIIKVNENQKIDFEYTYDDDIFLGWYNSDYTILLNDSSITSNIDIYALTTERGVQYRITYDLDGGTFNGTHPIKYYSGEETLLVDPVKEDNYEFTYWTLDGKQIEKISDTTYGNITLKANWKDVANYYSVKLHYDDAILSSQLNDTYRENSSLTLPYPIKDNYFFKGWYTDTTYTTKVDKDQTIKSNLELYAKFSEKTASNTYISFLGDSITTFDSYIPNDFITYYPAGDVQDVSDTWWYQVVNNLGYNLLVNDSYSGTLMTSGNNYGSSVERIKLLEKDGITPDIVIIHMGTNDFTHGMTKDAYKEAYINAIELIKTYYDDVTIYMCTLPYNTYNESFIDLRLQLNDAIREVASIYNIKVLNLDTVITKDNCTDLIYAGSHPNKKGMKAIADFVTSEIKGLF